MSIKIKLLISLLFLGFAFYGQTVKHVYKINDLLKRIESAGETTVINFWATWCKPCVEELPAFDSLAKAGKTKVILVCLDFKEDIEKKVNPFLKKKNITAECVLLDEINGNDYIDKVSKAWSGAIPASLFVNGAKRKLIEKKLKPDELVRLIEEIGQP